METDLLQTDSSRSAMDRLKRAQVVVNLGLSFNAFLAVIKLSGGILGHSQALLADGINSISDVVYFIVVKILVKLSGKPSDEEHPYGHHQFESIAALVIGAFVLTTGIAIFWDSINSAFDLFTGKGSESPVRWFTLGIAATTVAIKIFLMLHARTISRKTGSIAVTALARDHRNDIVASTGAAAGILFGLLGYPLFDPLAGAAVAIVVVKTGVEIIRESSLELMDTVPGREIESRIRELLTEFREIQTVEAVHAHRFGPYLMVNIIIGIDGTLSVQEGDRIADRAEQHLYANVDMLRKIYIHYHPATKA
jgi:cation diffusion facilitator family transporter